MLAARKTHYDALDALAKSIAVMDVNGSEMTEAILKAIIELYESAKVENEYRGDFFDTAYHAPVTGELEFIIARVLFHYSKDRPLGWKILLRRQVGKTAPDVRIEIRGRTVAVIEIKAKVGWMQSFFSPDQFKKERERFKDRTSKFDPDEANRKSKQQLSKYATNFEIDEKGVFLLLPTLALAHRKKYKTTLTDYFTHFKESSGLGEENLVLLSSNLNLDLSSPKGDLMPTGRFEMLLKTLEIRSQTLTNSNKVSAELEASNHTPSQELTTS